MLVDYLLQELSQRSKKNPAYSLRSFARSLRVNSGALSAIINKKRPLTVRTARKILDGLDLNSKTRTRLLQSLISEEARTPRDDCHILSEDLLRMVQNWEYFAILSMLEMDSVDTSARGIAQRFSISPATALETVESLKRLGLVKVISGKLRPTYKNLSTKPDVPSHALRHAHRQHLQKASQALDEQKIDERDFSGITMAIAKKKLPIAKQLIAQFRRDLCALLETGDRDEVYRLNIQLFSLEKQRGNK